MEKIIEQLETIAIEQNDLRRAIRYNWLRNMCTDGQYDDDTLAIMLQMIKHREPGNWPELKYKGK